MSKPKAFTYLRYSSVNQTGGVSLDIQRASCQHFIGSIPDLKLHEIVEKADEAKTGTTMVGRAQLKAILAEARPGDVVTIYKYDRLGRNLLEALQNLKALEEDLKVKVFSATEPNEPIVRHLLLAMAEEFSRQLGERCRSALARVATGGYRANKAPYGYRIIRPDGPKGRAKLEIIPEEAAFVRLAFEMRRDSNSYYAITQTLNDRGAKPRKSRLWAFTAIRYMLDNETYLGRSISGARIYKKGYRGPGSGKKRPRSEWHVGENAHEAIVTQELWDAAHAVDLKKGKDTYRVKTASRHKYLWTGFLRCSECGSNLNRIKTRNGIWYGCENGKRFGRCRPCNKQRLVREDVLAREVMGAFRSKVYSTQWVDDVIKVVREEIKLATTSTEEFLGPLRNALKKAIREIDVAERRLARVPEDSLPAFLDELKDMKAHRDDLTRQIEEGEKMSGGVINPDVLEAKVRARLKNLWDILAGQEAEMARQELAKHIDRIVVRPDKTAQLIPKQDGLLADLLPEVILNRGSERKAGNEALPPERERGSSGIPTGI